LFQTLVVGKIGHEGAAGRKGAEAAFTGVATKARTSALARKRLRVLPTVTMLTSHPRCAYALCDPVAAYFPLATRVTAK